MKDIGRHGKRNSDLKVDDKCIILFVPLWKPLPLLLLYFYYIIIMAKYTVYAKITIPYLIDIDAKDVDQAQKIAEEQPFTKWLINPEEAIYHDDYLIEVDSVQPRREIK